MASQAEIPVPDAARHFQDNGYFFPVDVLSQDAAGSHRARLEALEQQLGDTQVGNKSQLNHPHVIFRFADQIVRTPRILDVVESLIGPDLMVWGSTFFIKEPNTESYVSWHQDLRYWGLDSDALVSAWVALSPVTRANGCMRFLSGSHKDGLVAHKDTFDETNFLTRGQEADVEIDESSVAHVELQPGQASFHHGRLLHASAPNHSDERRIGLTINYLAPHMRQVVAQTDFAMLVRGEDRYGHFQQVPPPAEDLDAQALAWHDRVLSAQNEALYAKAEPPTG